MVKHIRTLALGAILSLNACTFTSTEAWRLHAEPSPDGVNRYVLHAADRDVLEYRTFSHNPFIPFAYGGFNILIEAPRGYFQTTRVITLPSADLVARLFRVGHGWDGTKPEELSGSVAIQRVEPHYARATLSLRGIRSGVTVEGTFKFKNGEFWNE